MDQLWRGSRRTAFFAPRCAQRAAIQQLTPAWRWVTGELPITDSVHNEVLRPGKFEATPLVIRNTLHVVTPFNRAVALDAVRPGSGDANIVANGFDNVQVYDTATDRWTGSEGSPGAPTPLPQARGGTGKAGYMNGEFWVIGAETVDGEHANAFGTYTRVVIYNPRTNRWRRGPDLPTARHGIFPLLDHGRILVAAGGARAGRGKSRVVEVIWP